MPSQDTEFQTTDLRPDYERPRLDDPLYIENKNPVGYAIHPADGLPAPMPMTTTEQAENPPLNPDTFVCMEAEGRPQCSHYKRQLLPWQNDSERVVCLRYCTALKNENGELVNVGDSEVHACEFRDPPDAKSQVKLKVFDDKIVEAARKEAEKQEEFDPLEALKKEQ